MPPVSIIGGTDKATAEVSTLAGAAWTSLAVASGDFASLITGDLTASGEISDFTIWNRDESATVWIALRPMSDEPLTAGSGAVPVGPGNSYSDTVYGCNVEAISVAAESASVVVTVNISILPV